MMCTHAHTHTHSMYSIYDFVPKGAHAEGYALQLKIKLKPFFFEIVRWICVWMHEYWVHTFSATRLQVVLIYVYSRNKQKKHWNLTAKNGHPPSLCLWTSGNHMEYLSLISNSMRKLSFYTSNTSAFMTVLFSINCSWKFVLSHIRCVVISNCKLCTTPKQQPCFGISTVNIVCVPCIYITQQWSIFFSEVCVKY